MKAWRVYDLGDMRLDEIPLPSVKPGWVLVKVRLLQPSVSEVVEFHGKDISVGINIRRMIQEKGPLQLFGHEFCGEVVETGEGITNVKIGDRVFYHTVVPCHSCILCRTGHEDYCRTIPVTVGRNKPGCLAEYITLPANAIASIPDSITDNEAAAMQPLVAVVANVHAANIKAGDTVVVLGQGVMGLDCMQVSRACGAGIVIGIDIRDETLALSNRLGADITINASKVNPVDAVLEITDGVGANVVFECAGGSPEQGLSGSKTLEQAVDLVCNGGKIIQLAFLSQDATLRINTIDRKSIHYIGRSLSQRKLVPFTIGLVKSKRVQIVPAINYVLDGLDKVPEAFNITGNKSKFGATNPVQVIVAR